MPERPTNEGRGHDRYGRTLAVCKVDGFDIGAEMVRSGMGCEFDYVGSKRDCKPAWITRRMEQRITMTAKSTSFEKLVERIHRVLDGEDAKVMWNEKVPDPDNPNQARQIDVTIRRADSLTIVECRIHQSPQDVTWIEELMGRRTSLAADLVIAVSSSGFTDGARRKAERYGIVLRDFESLSIEELQNWGRQKKIHLSFLEFSDTVLDFTLPDFPTGEATFTDQEGNPITDWQPLFRHVMKRLDEVKELRNHGATITIATDIHTPILLVNGVRATKVELRATVRRVLREVELASLVAYADPLKREKEPAAKIGSYNLGQSELIESLDRVYLVVDLSRIEFPPDCFLDTVNYDHGRVVTLLGTEIIGASNALITTAKMRIRFSVV